MTPEDFAPLEISRYELRLRAEEACTLPPFLGSTLRGAFGHALKEAVFAMDGRECNGCDAADPCVYHYLFETPVPPDVVQLRGQREAPVPFILSPPIVENPVRRLWRVPAAASAVSGSEGRGGFARNETRNPQSSIRDSQSSTSLRGSAGLGGFARNDTCTPQSSIRNSQSSITSVVFPDQPRRFAAGDILLFHLTLIGRATDYLPHVILAMSGMARRGLGSTRARFELKEVIWKGANGSEPIWANGVFLGGQAFVGAQASRLPGAGADMSRPVEMARPLSLLIGERLAELTGARPEQNPSASPSLETTIAEALGQFTRPDLQDAPRLAPGSSPLAGAGSPSAPSSLPVARLKLRLLTPTRIRVHGDLQTDLSFELLVRNLLRRISTLAAVHGRGAMELDYRGLIERAASVEARSSRLVWWDLDRYSNRQQTKMKLGGFIGEVEYEGEAIAEFLPLLVAGELLNIGTGTSFGLGSYRILECANTPHGSVGMVQILPT